MADADLFAAMIAGLTQAGLTRGEICRKTGLSPASISRAASGQMRQPSYGTFNALSRLCEKVGVKPGQRFVAKFHKTAN